MAHRLTPVDPARIKHLPPEPDWPRLSVSMLHESCYLDPLAFTSLISAERDNFAAPIWPSSQGTANGTNDSAGNPKSRTKRAGKQAAKKRTDEDRE